MALPSSFMLVVGVIVFVAFLVTLFELFRRFLRYLKDSIGMFRPSRK